MSSSGNGGNCDCGSGSADPVLTNAPGLAALAYRVGTYSTFLRRMQEQLPQQEVPPGQTTGTSRPLAPLTTRTATDPTMALLDAWAMVMDVLTFYQERIVNEGYLRTATERVSVLELGRATGHELHAGVAATTYIAFTAEDTPGSPDVAAIPEGTKVQSLPGPGELPQTFETLQDFGARAVWNGLRPRTAQPQTVRLSSDSGTLQLEGLTATGYQLRDHLYLSGANLNLKAGDVLVLVQRGATGAITATLAATVNSVAVDQTARRTRVNLAAGTPSVTPLAPDPVVPSGKVIVTPTPLTLQNVKDNIIDRFWSEADLRAQMGIQSWSDQDLIRYAAQLVANAPDAIEVYAMRQRVSIFGANAPIYYSLDRSGLHYPFYTSGTDYNWDDSSARPIWQRSTQTSGGYNYYSQDFGADIFLERSVPEIVPGSLILLQGRSTYTNNPFSQVYVVRGTLETALNEFAISGKSTGLFLGLTATPDTALTTSDKTGDRKFRTTTAYVQSERLQLAPLLIDDPVGKDHSVNITLDGMTLGLSVGQPVWIHGELSEAPTVVRDEVVPLLSITHQGGLTTLGLSLANSYRRATLTMSANVVLASHGETAQVEILGSGDARLQNQNFTLKKKNITYLPAATQSGTQSTVQITVNGIPWKEVPSLYEQDGRSETFTLRSEDDGTTTVYFGDGEHGARLPSGRENVVATYRTCDASAGSIAAGRVSLLKTRPLGIRSAVNPLPAGGNSGPETLEQGRRNAPLETQIVDRIVTLQDYQGFASAFPGVGKAYARLVWNGRAQVVHVTIGGMDGNPLNNSATLMGNLVQGMNEVSDPSQSVAVDYFKARYFSISAELILAKDSDRVAVMAAARTMLLTAFSFANRSFAQAVTAAEIALTLQAVPGVRAVVLLRLALLEDTTTGGPPAAKLDAGDTRFDGTQVVPAELLILSDSGIVLVEIDE